MPTTYKYELWNGKEILGYYSSNSLLFGNEVVVPYLSALKQPYNQKIKAVRCRLALRPVSDDGITFVWRNVIDVKRKSKAQVNFLKGVK